jgi:glycosyltransferase involved in cell wall biosynthesis
VQVLALVTDAFGGRGGIALYNRDLLTALCSYPSCEKVVALPRLVSDTIEKLPEKLIYITDGINNKVRYVKTVLDCMKNNRQFELILCGHINLLPVAYIASLWLKAPILLVIYGIDAWKPNQSFLHRYLINKIEAFISISNATKQRFLQWAKLEEGKGFILPNAIHPDLYGTGPKNSILLSRYGLQGKTVLLTVGRLSAEEHYKGFDEVIGLLPELSEDIPDVIYLIVGDGTDRQRLEEKANALGVSDKVVFAGYIPEGEKADHYRLADVFIMPGKGEGFGFVFLEAMACGIPVIASKVDGSREAVRDGKLGIVVDPENAEEIKAAILQSLNYPRGQIPDGLDYFYFDNFQSRLHDIINTAMAGIGD